MARNDIFKIENARIIFRNFGGNPTKFRPAGDRTFAVVIPDEATANAMTSNGWNVKMRPPREEGDTPLFYLEVKVSYDVAPPKIFMVTSRRKQLLNEETVGQLDAVDIDFCDIEISPYHWTVNGKSGVKAYLKTMYVNVIEDSFADKYSDIDG